MDVRTQTSLFCGALALAIALSVLLRGKPGRAQWLFGAFAVDIGLWYLAQWRYFAGSAQIWARSTAVLAVLMPQFALHLFDAIFPQAGSRVLVRTAHVLGGALLVAVLSPQHEHALVRAAVFVYVIGLLAAGLTSLLLRAERSGSRATQRRVRFLVACGALATVFSCADFLWFVGAPLPPVGAVLSVVFLFVLAESLIRARLVDLYDMAGLALVSTALAFSLAGIFYLFVVALGGFQAMYLNAVLGGIVMFILFDPLRDKLDAYIRRVFFLERHDLEEALERARQQLAHVLDARQMVNIVLGCLEDSRRATSAAIYLRGSLGADFELAGSFGAAAPSRLDAAALHPLLDALLVYRSLDLGQLESSQPAAFPPSAGPLFSESSERLLAGARLLGKLSNGVCTGVVSQQQELMALIVVCDDRVSDAFSAEDLVLLESLALQAAIVLENSRQHWQLQERTRLAALGQMAAGLAHEVKNPLGAIKGAAQLLADPRSAQDAAQQDFVQIILDEVERLDRVVGAVLDYARPSPGQQSVIDLNRVVERTAALEASNPQHDTQLAVATTEGKLEVRADAEQLRQVLLNLIQNAIQANERRGTVHVATRRRTISTTPIVEVSVRDAGPGIPEAVRRHLFVPFFTTKPHGTGLGLAISERIVQAMGGHIEVASEEGKGATFTVVLPAATEPTLAAATPLAVSGGSTLAS